MSYELKIDPKRRVAGRFIGSVRKALISAALDEKKHRGLTQQKVAECMGVNRSVINRMLRGEVNLTLRSVAELAWAMGWEPRFSLHRIEPAEMGNEAVHVPPHTHVVGSPRSVSPVKVYNVGASTKNKILAAAE